MDLPSAPCEGHEFAPVRQSTRVRETSSHLKDCHCFSTIMSLIEPSLYKEANSNHLWQQAMDEELQALEKTRTWDYVNLPREKKPITCKWILKSKRTMMTLLNDTKHDLWPKVILINMTLIMKKHRVA